MQSEAAKKAAECRIVDIGDFSGRKQGKSERQLRRAQEADDKFASLGERKQRAVLSHMIGYMEAAKDLISSGRQARPNEVSSMFGAMENMINESWDGGTV